MEFRVFTVGLHGSENQEQELNKFLRSHKAVSVDKEFVNNSLQSFWSFCVCFLSSGAPPFYKENKPDPVAALSQDHLVVYEKLRTVRNTVAKKINVPAYAVFTNEELSILSQETTITATQLTNLKGFGEGRMEKTGKTFLAIWHETSKEPVPEN
jgi:superfamily II DNA helicase RecQ